MSLRTLPALNGLNLRAGTCTELAPDALAQWDDSLRALLSDDAATISVLDVIGSDIFGGGFTAKRMDGALRSIGQNKPVVVLINSPGGDVFEGLALYELLRLHQGEVTVKIIGLAASAASIVAMAGDHIEIGRAGFVMMHKAQGVAVGDEDDFRNFANLMRPINEAMAGIYAARTGKDQSEMLSWMRGDGTWLGGEEAIAEGFADVLLPADQVAKDQPAQRDAPMRSMLRADAMLARRGVPRSERKELVKLIEGGMRGAAPGDMRGAVAEAADVDLEAMLANLRSITP